MAIRGDQGEAARELQPQRAQHLVDRDHIVGDEQQQIARGGIEPLGYGTHFVLGQELGDRRAPAAVLHERPHQPLSSVLLGELGQRVELRARQFPRAGVDATDHAAVLQCARKHLELRARDGFPDILELEPEARVGPVGAIARDCFGERDPRPGR